MPSNECLVYVIGASALFGFLVLVIGWSITKLFKLGQKHARRKGGDEPPSEAS